MEEKVFKVDWTRVSIRFAIFLSIYAFFFLGFLYLALTGSFQRAMPALLLTGIGLVAVLILPFFMDFYEVRIRNHEILITQVVSKKTRTIPFEHLREIKFVHAEPVYPNFIRQGPYIYFSFKNPAKKKLFDKAGIKLHSIKPRKDFLLALSQIPCEHIYNTEKTDFKELAKGW